MLQMYLLDLKKYISEVMHNYNQIQKYFKCFYFLWLLILKFLKCHNSMMLGSSHLFIFFYQSIDARYVIHCSNALGFLQLSQVPLEDISPGIDL